MADKLRKILGLDKKRDLVDAGSRVDDSEDCVTVEKTGSLTELKEILLKKSKLGFVVSQKKERKKSRSESCLHDQPRAPLCGGESNVSIYSLSPKNGTAGSQSLRVGILKKANLRETQSCEILDQNQALKHDPVRKTVSMASSAKIREDTNILRNIKKREVMNAIKLNGKSSSLSGIGSYDRNFPSKTKMKFDMKLSERPGKCGSPDWKESQFIGELLDWHNLLRARHGVRQLQLDYKLCQMAQSWANFLAHTNEFHYQNPKEYGENLLLWPLPILPPSSLATKCPDVTGRYVATYWYRSHSTFPYQADPDVLQSYASAFTQLVWAASEQFGCGKARSSNGKVIVVAYYYPRGNVPDKYHLNVVQPRETIESM